MKKLVTKALKHNSKNFIKRTNAGVKTKIIFRINYKVNKRTTSKTRSVNYVVASNLFTFTSRKILSGDFQKELLPSS